MLRPGFRYYRGWGRSGGREGNGKVIDRLESEMKKLEGVRALAEDPNLGKDQKKYREVMKELSRLEEIADAYARYKAMLVQLDEAKSLSREEDPDMREMARQELERLEAVKPSLESSLERMLVPPDPLADKNIIVEIRAGTGGEEAALFAADLFRMYERFAARKGWKVEAMDASESGLGGYKEIIFSVSGNRVYESMRHEAGTHRVQRVPETEASGRIHTSAVTVAVLPEAEEADVVIRPEDLRIDVMRASGPGGQCVNTTDSAVRLTHLPTGITVHCQDEKSQIKNRAKAMRILRARLYEAEAEKLAAERAADRKSQVGSGDRSERIRTYNFPQNRLTDHRVDLTLYKLELVMQGDLDEVVDALVEKARRDSLAVPPT
jgi:peptide chain release factor 1